MITINLNPDQGPMYREQLKVALAVLITLANQEGLSVANNSDSNPAPELAKETIKSPDQAPEPAQIPCTTGTIDPNKIPTGVDEEAEKAEKRKAAVAAAREKRKKEKEAAAAKEAAASEAAAAVEAESEAEAAAEADVAEETEETATEVSLPEEGVTPVLMRTIMRPVLKGANGAEFGKALRDYLASVKYPSVSAMGEAKDQKALDNVYLWFQENFAE